MAHLAINHIEFAFGWIEIPYSYGIIMHSYKFVWILIEISDVLATLIRLIGCNLQSLTLSLCHIPYNN
jgi:hypothetical protein